MTQTHLDLAMHQDGIAVTVQVSRLSFGERCGLAAACLRGLVAGRFTLRTPHASLRCLSHGRPVELMARA